jgi:hypothetical protein
MQIDIFTPSKPSQQVIDGFLDLGPEKAAKPDRGSTLAWLGHLEVLQNMVASGSATALILEDDVDWDIAIKSQMKR